ncbi:MAG: hypothetical protein MUP47_06790 [Phycisphaerae bacterium]|nr:hypothetical protein [Phycisphaerae bacterium]
MSHKVAVRLTVALLALVGMMFATGVSCRRKPAARPKPTTRAARAPATSTAATAAINAVNITCPITGNKIDPAKVPDSLTRHYKGKKVGFCCGACPPAWDKLTDAEKDAKLQAALPKP